jgi:hypothetical protein
VILELNLWASDGIGALVFLAVLACIYRASTEAADWALDMPSIVCLISRLLYYIKIRTSPLFSLSLKQLLLSEKNNFLFLYLSHHTIFEIEILQIT